MQATTDLQLLELGGSTKKTQWQCVSQLVAVKPSGEIQETKQLGLRIAHVHKDQTAADG